MENLSRPSFTRLPINLEKIKLSLQKNNNKEFLMRLYAKEARIIRDMDRFGNMLAQLDQTETLEQSEYNVPYTILTETLKELQIKLKIVQEEINIESY